MPVRRLKPFLLLLLVAVFLAPSLGVQASRSGWRCEGRICGWLVCCCVDNVAKQDPNCSRIAAASGNQASLCGAECGCTLQIEQSHTPHSRLGGVAATIAPLLAILPATPAMPTATLLRSCPVASFAPRGPPAARVAVACPSLRAPPAS